MPLSVAEQRRRLEKLPVVGQSKRYGVKPEPESEDGFYPQKNVIIWLSEKIIGKNG